MRKQYLAAATCVASMLAGSLAAATAPQSLPQQLPSAANQIGCAGPVGRGDSAAALLRRFGANARKETVPGAEGETMQAVVLYPRDPQRRLEVVFGDDKMLHPSSITLRAARSVWSLAGLHIGDGLDQVTGRNARGFVMSGFEWDYGGTVTDLKDGALAHLPGGCTVTIRFSTPASLQSTPEALMGDVPLQSNNPALRRVRPTVSELALNWR